MGRYRAPAPPSSKYITPEGAARLREELDHLWKTKRPAVTRAVAAAAAEGDRSENAEYIYGKKQLAEIDRRVRYLRKRFDGLTIVGEPPSDTSRIYFGAYFELAADSGETASYRLVGPDEIGFAPENVSLDSPMGRAVLGKAIGDAVVVETPHGRDGYEIVDVSYWGS